jgi:CBS domain-containing protein
MRQEDVERYISAASQVRFGRGERVLSPADGVARRMFVVCQGSVHATAAADGTAAVARDYEAGAMFPVDAVMAGRPVTATYRAEEETVCLQLDFDQLQDIARDSRALEQFLKNQTGTVFERSRRPPQAHRAWQNLAEQSLEAPLARLPRRTPLVCTANSPLGDALESMHARRVGSIVVLDDTGAAQGVLTRHDLLERVVLRQLPLSTPMSQVMSSPVHTLSLAQTAQDAALLMLRHGIRHLPLTEEGRVVSIISEHDLFASQRMSLKHVGSAIRAAADTAMLKDAARDIRRLARELLAQGLRARQLTELISRLNDLLTQRLIELISPRHGCDMTQACWLSFGSEGRSEQTISTDQDNGLVFRSDEPDRERTRWLAFAEEVNLALDACGYPLCKGQVMASNPACCLTPDEWCARFTDWMERGTPQDILKASIYFDFRPLAGDAALALPMRELVARRAAQLPRFIRLLVENALRSRAPLNWRGAVAAVSDGSHRWLDLKLQGAALFVEAARVYALAHGIGETNTRARLEAVAAALQVSDRERDTWIDAFEYLQMLRLQTQVLRPEDELLSDPHPNRVDMARLSDIDRRIVREAIRAARELQQRMQLDYVR